MFADSGNCLTTADLTSICSDQNSFSPSTQRKMNHACNLNAVKDYGW